MNRVTGPEPDHQQDEIWTAALCREVEAELFFPTLERPTTDQAKRVCAQCAVRVQCLELALRLGETHGVWGGATPAERAQLRRTVSGHHAPSAARRWVA